jgi:hypothetical protein
MDMLRLSQEIRALDSDDLKQVLEIVRNKNNEELRYSQVTCTSFFFFFFLCLQNRRPASSRWMNYNLKESVPFLHHVIVG